MTMNHGLKVLPEFFEPLERGEKTFEVRKNDRNFRVGDVLSLEEWDAYPEMYTGRTCHRIVTYILHGGFPGIEDGYCVLGMKKLEQVQEVMP